MTKLSTRSIQWLLVALLGGAAVVSLILDFAPGIRAGRSFRDVMIEMLKILPCAFVLISLFEQWVKREVIERHLGPDCGVRGYLWAILLAGMSVGGLFVAFPMAHSLWRKGASLKVVFAYLGFAGVCRIPMTLFEISFLGWKFSALRLAVSIPIMLASGILLGGFLQRRGYEIRE